MTKEQLKKYRTLKAELIDIEADIKAKTVHDSVQRSKREFPYTFGHYHIEGVPDEGAFDENYDLLIRKSKIKAQIREIEKFVNGIEDIQLQRIFRLRYLTSKKKLSWLCIAMKIGYSSEHTPKRKHDTYLKKILKNGGNGGF